MSVNIPSYVEDSNYRYKMPRVRCKVEGSGNGIKTNFMNIGDVSKALKRPPEYLTKFLGCELCVQARFIGTEQKGIFQGVHSEQEISTMLDKFVAEYVLCPKCDLPEIDLHVDNKFLFGKCNACGNECKMNNIHRVAAYILKNPPEITTVATKKKKKKEAGTEQLDEEGKVEKKGKRRVKKDVPAVPEGGDGGEKKKVRRRKKKKGDGSSFGLRKDQGNMVITRLQGIKKEDNATPDSFCKELRTLQLAQNFTHKERTYMGFAGLMNPSTTIPREKAQFSKDEFLANLPYITEFCDVDVVDSDDILNGFVEFAYYEMDEETYANLPVFIKTLYDGSILDESDILLFFDDDREEVHVTKAKAAVEPLLSWFKEVSEDDYDDEYSGETDE